MGLFSWPNKKKTGDDDDTQPFARGEYELVEHEGELRKASEDEEDGEGSGIVIAESSFLSGGGAGGGVRGTPVGDIFVGNESTLAITDV